MNNTSKKIVLIANVSLLKVLSDALTNNEYEVVKQLPLLSEVITAEITKLNPNFIFISETAHTEEGYTLVHAIQSILIATKKLKNKPLIVVQTNTRKMGDPLLSDLVSIGVFNFINKNEYDLKELLYLLENPREYSDVASYHNLTQLSEFNDLPLIAQTEEVKPKEVVREIIREVPVISKGLKETTIFLGWENAGKSFIAVNYGTLLSTLGAKVALIDANEPNYGLSAYFKIPDDHKGLNALIDNETTEAIKYAAKPVSNLFVFTNTHPGREILTNEYSLIQEKLRETVDVLLIDGSAKTSTFLNEVLFQVTKVIIVVTPNLPKILVLREQIEKWKQEGINLNKFKGVLNQYVSSKVIDAKSVAELLGIKVITEVEPLYPLAYESQIYGEPALTLSTSARLKEALLPLVDNIWASKPQKSFFKKILVKKGW